MKIHFHGAAREVTGSMHLLEVNGDRILLDCGLFQGRRAESNRRNRELPFDPGSIDSVVLSHAHIDHCGALPTLVRGGFKGNIYCTSATRDLAAVMLMDAAHIQQKDAEFYNRKHPKEPIEPVYTDEHAMQVVRFMVGYSYGREITVGRGVRAVFFDAGHILGSAGVQLDLDEHGRRLRLFFTGDLGRVGIPILRDPGRPQEPVDVLITESTYGNRTHPPLPDVAGALARVINRACDEGGRVVIPAFSLGRTQNLVWSLRELVQDKRIPKVPVFVDSPLSSRATEVFKMHPECYDADARAYLARGQDPFGYPGLEYITRVEDSMKLNERTGAFVVISASGMCEAGRVLHHLKHSVGNARNTVLLVGFQAEHTLGRRLQDGADTVRIFGDECKVRCRIESVGGLSAHGDREDLLRHATAIQGTRRSFVVHGEPEPAEALAAGLREAGLEQPTAPARGQAFEL